MKIHGTGTFCYIYFIFYIFCFYFRSFAYRFYWILYLIFFVLLPINAPLEYWDDSIQAALFVAFSLRYLIVLNVSWLITSAHFIWGLDKKHKPSDSNMIFLVTKSYWPQYHYLLPFDYQTGEFGNYGKHLQSRFISFSLLSSFVYLTFSVCISVYACVRECWCSLTLSAFHSYNIASNILKRLK